MESPDTLSPAAITPFTFNVQPLFLVSSALIAYPSIADVSYGGRSLLDIISSPITLFKLSKIDILSIPNGFILSKTILTASSASKIIKTPLLSYWCIINFRFFIC